ncbi:phosphoesterase [Sporocytophaga myxococcoides]|uniref:Phosphoesterase n=1 Tax=Sporocytophaga myxococcoides TaxID=153721 RepID=A0A098LHD5_9BACT|nr:bifunctional oligoribonuclease/PAP phosphatase NrnA [Sporocytophaga myxococcoides]GAL86386.1 phosphoesterase [Sporocytophaga myxococcoides]
MNPYKEIENEILNASHILITAHKSPDGDSVGSSLGLLHFIERLGKKAVIGHPDPAPEFLQWLEGIDSILYMERDGEVLKNHFQKADLIFCLDYNATDRVGPEMQQLLKSTSAKKIMIDHHLNPENFVDITVSATEVCSTAQLIYELIEQSGHADLLSEKIGTALYLGILTDTGSFRFPSVQPRTHEILGKLLGAGVSHHLIHEQLNDNNTVARLQLQGYAMSEKLEILDSCHAAIISLTEAELTRFKAQKGDTDGLANLALSIKGIRIAVCLYEKEGKIKMSFRSKGQENPVNILAEEHFDGGGHANASGGISELGMDATLKKLKTLLPVYYKSDK